jgi:heat shock protein 4
VIPSLKSFNLTKTDPVEITLFYDPTPPGFSPIIQQIRVPSVKHKHAEFHTKIRIRLDHNGLTHLEDVTLLEEFMEEVKVPIVKEGAAKDATMDAK